MSAARLYTPEVLALAASLAQWPWIDGLANVAHARSRSCGSRLALGMEFDGRGRLVRLGLRAQACAIGQAAAAIFAASAPGRTLEDFADEGDRLAAWLAGEEAMPAIAGLGAIAAARDYPARHGAMMLAWTAARELLSSRVLSR